MDWKFVDPSSGSKLAVLGALQNVPDDHQLGFGISRFAGFPSNAELRMNPRYPKQLALGDSYSNLADHFIASARLAELVRAHTPRDLELLPVTLIDHKGRPVTSPHVIIHPLRTVDAIDRDRSDFELNAIDPTFISDAPHIELDPALLPVDVGVCRVTLIKRRILVSPALVRAIDEAGMTGVDWLDVADYHG